ncbi:hypothetical protein LCGC14_3067890, partial [marine sediment metagenome]
FPDSEGGWICERHKIEKGHDKYGSNCYRCRVERIEQLQADLDKYKDALAAKFNAEMCEALKPLKAKLATAKTENERLRELREELCLIIGRGVSVARPVAYHEIIPWVREAVAIARQHGLFERKTAVEREALKEVKP